MCWYSWRESTVQPETRQSQVIGLCGNPMPLQKSGKIVFATDER